ncbi:MAG: hypothetical protein MI784_12015 [Cytophagales bacterium]|nr:hypothetical protein [Cytophagales bacterium]
MKRFSFSILFTVLFHFSFAQEEALWKHLENRLMEGVGVEELEENWEQLYLRWVHPQNINQVSEKELEAMGLLFPYQIEQLSVYRERYGDLLSPSELYFVRGFDGETVALLRPFFYFGKEREEKRPGLKELIANPRVRLRTSYHGKTPLSDIAESLADEERRTKGNWMHQGRVLTRHLALGWVAQQDEGEPWSWQSPRPDYLNGYVSLRNFGRLEQLILGGSRAHFGQGLVFGSVLFSGKSTAVISNADQGGFGFSPYASSGESGYLSGLAFTFRLTKRMRLSALYSRTKEDASRDEEQRGIKTLLVSGLHRTGAERDNESRLSRRLWGGNIDYVLNRSIRAGINVALTRFSIPFSERTELYKRHSFSGDRLLSWSVYASYDFKSLHLMGEWALSSTGGRGVFLSLINKISPSLKFSASWRSYTRDFHSFYGKTLAEQAMQNETGFCLGVSFVPSRRWTVQAYADYVYFPWHRFRVSDTNTRGKSFLLKAVFRKSAAVLFSADLRWKTGQQDYAASNNEALAEPFSAWQLAGRIRHRLSPDGWQLQWTAVLKRRGTQFEQAAGSGLFCDLSRRMDSWLLKSRLAAFRTEYLTRIYLYEPAALYQFSVPFYLGKGIKYVGVVEKKWGSRWRLSAKVAWTRTEEASEGEWAYFFQLVRKW